MNTDHNSLISFDYFYLLQIPDPKQSATDDSTKICSVYPTQNNNKIIYKIGQTMKIHNRFSAYPKNSILHLLYNVKNCKFVEDETLK